VYEGHARFESPRTVGVNGALLEADAIFINVGARALIPDLPGLAEVDYLTNSSMMDVDYLPEHLVIIGGSYIGLEFAQMYRRFGSRVTIVEMAPRLIAKEDDEISEAIRIILEEDGIAVRRNAKCIGMAKRNGGVAVNVSCDEPPQEVVASHVLLAVGRVPEYRGSRARQRLASSPTSAVTSLSTTSCVPTCPGYGHWATSTARGAFTHTSYNDYEIVAANLLDHDKRRVTGSNSGVCPLYRSAVGTRGNDAARSAGIGTRRCSSGR
jgi:pyruvate/2-oxoglutarate dehydrogenase complex dihydrolipoamide dehydrogenase (E3) component